MIYAMAFLGVCIVVLAYATGAAIIHAARIEDALSRLIANESKVLTVATNAQTTAERAMRKPCSHSCNCAQHAKLVRDDMGILATTLRREMMAVLRK